SIVGSVHTGLWDWKYEVYSHRSLNTLTQIAVKGTHVTDKGKWSLMKFSELHFSEAECNSRLNDIHQSDGFSLVLLEE
ncbi:hypothetical protein Tco_1469188, partial [Tanacetum coccineum]